ncbi:MAG: adenosylcobinamide amidohydrolase [Oscillospiraceae bacterium]|nr:adenosylcobinamide amidohydrolase [Oscillospiraceae bacterium]
MLLTTLCTGEEVHRYKKSIVVFLNGKRKTLATSPHNGGYRENLTAVFNNDATRGAGVATTLDAPTYAEHMALLSEKLGLDPDTSAGISTAAQMENVSIKSERYKDITVTAIVTGGVEVNGGRAGDPASWDELENKAIEYVKHGTINIILHVNVDLSEGALARAMVMCTEAKTVALQELQAPSRYSMGLATGSGTDGTILIANADSKIHLTNAGNHVKLGELIGRAVKDAVTEALLLQSGLSPESQHNALKRVDRFGITDDLLWAQYKDSPNDGLNRARFSDRIDKLMRQDMLVTYTSLYAHLLDQMMWKLLSPAEAIQAAGVLLRAMDMPPLKEKKHPADVMDGLHLLLGALMDGFLSLLGAANPESTGNKEGEETDDSL